MKRIEMLDLSSLQPGMRLGQDIRDSRGNLQLAADRVLGEREIEALRRLGLEQVPVARDEELSPEHLAALIAETERRLARLFEKSRDNELMARLHQAVLAYRLEQIK